MPDYRFYALTSAGAISGPGEDFRCAGDVAALARARELLLEPFEVWQGSRKVYVSNMAAEHSHERCIVSRERGAMTRLLINESKSAIAESRELLRRTRRD